jgi:uncharacterized protein
MIALRRFVVFLLCVYAAICVYMFAKQRDMQYRPDPSPMNPASVSLPNAQQETIVAGDGERIVVWWIPPRDDHQLVLLYLHGNGANLHNRAARFSRLTQSGFGLFAVSWRGYGGSSGIPSELGLRLDARGAYEALIASKRVDPKRIVLFGESLGTTVATLLASEVAVAALVLDSSFDSALDVAMRAYPWLPVRWLLRDQYRADLAASKVKVPVQQFHCVDDPVTPLASAQSLHTRFANARSLHVIEGRCHVPSLTRYEAALDAFMRTLTDAR